MERIACKKCNIPYRKKSLVAHEAKCLGGIHGFTPVREKSRFVYRCQTCGLSVRRQGTDRHQKRCLLKSQSEKFPNQLMFTASSVTDPKNISAEPPISNEEEIIRQDSGQAIMEKSQNEEKQSFQLENIPYNQQIEFQNTVKKSVMFEEFYDEEEQQPLQPLPISKQVIQREKNASYLAKINQTHPVSNHPKLIEFRVRSKTEEPSITQAVEIYALSCFLRMIGRFTQQKTWQLAHGLIKKSEYWQFVKRVQPWIFNNKTFVGIVEEKLKYFNHDQEHFIVTNFDFIYQRVKGLIENFSLRPQKLEGVFKKPIHKRQGYTRMKRKDPETAKLRRKLIRYRSRQKIERKWRKNPYGMRNLTKLKYQAMKYQIQVADEAFEMRQVFSKRPSHHHRAEIARKRQRMLLNQCMSTIADRLTASFVLGEFKIWSKSIESIDPEKRYLYANQIPNIPHFQIWYPLTMDILEERRWLYPHVYASYSNQFQSPLPQLTQQQIFHRLCAWYRSKGLLIEHALYELQGFDGIRAMLDDKYRIEQEKERKYMISSTIDVNPMLFYAEDAIESEPPLSDSEQQVVFAADVPARGDPAKWKIVSQAEHLTRFNNCAACEQPLKFPAPSCKSCLSAYHYPCRRQLKNICLCFVYSDLQHQQMAKMMQKAIKQATIHAKKVDLNVKAPKKASLMELKYQAENLGLNMKISTHMGLWCRPGCVFYKPSNVMYLQEKSVEMIDNFGNIYVFPGIVEEITGKGRGVIATRQIQKDEIVAIYPGKLVTQAEIFQFYKRCKYIFNFQHGPTSFTSWAIVPEVVAHLGMFINHGLPNVKPNRFWSSKGPIVIFISIRNIEMGEEILYDHEAKILL